MELFIFLAAGTVLMLIVMLYLRKFYQLNIWKTVMLSVILTISGTIGTKVLYWIENGSMGGVSFFGAIFFAPILMILVAVIMKISIGTVLDICAPAECMMLTLMKISCLTSGCCKGRIIGVIGDVSIRFPSQIVEMIASFILMLCLVILIKKNKYHNQIYACYMIGYGVMRFTLNWFRETTEFILKLPAGNFWSIISVCCGIVIIWYMNNRKNYTRNS